ncbi:hypothetical protein RF11_11949 [Thelohanellus kitauei]|uniref:Uncharacterized protein n=1 Tax=Thelohanellus kitauei TaxID=669202 RepID=A0A0C2MX19_THEKT|nr:hypothetical protein RF11_11949 [Thelohanellus kitauei]
MEQIISCENSNHDLISFDFNLQNEYNNDSHSVNVETLCSPCIPLHWIPNNMPLVIKEMVWMQFRSQLTLGRLCGIENPFKTSNILQPSAEDKIRDFTKKRYFFTPKDTNLNDQNISLVNNPNFHVNLEDQQKPLDRYLFQNCTDSGIDPFTNCVNIMDGKLDTSNSFDFQPPDLSNSISLFDGAFSQNMLVDESFQLAEPLLDFQNMFRNQNEDKLFF